MNNETTVFPPLDKRGVPQPDLTTTDIIIIVLILLLWTYSIFLTIRAWHKIMSDGSSEMSDGYNWWRWVESCQRVGGSLDIFSQEFCWRRSKQEKKVCQHHQQKWI